MEDHLALLVDQLLTESTLEAAIKNKSKTQIMPNSESPVVPVAEYTKKRKGENFVECRICQEEDEVSNMEIPCSCCGSMKYAHRNCVQKWCNEKGDTTCEICLQQFKPGYTTLPELFHHGSIPMNFRGSWELSRRDLHDSQIITMAPSDRDFMDSFDYDYHAASTARSALCCRTVAIIFTALLVLRHTLPLMIGESEEYSVALFSILVLRTIAVLIPIVVLVRILNILYRRRQQQEARNIPISGSDEESLSRRSIYQSHLMRIR